MKKLLYLLLGAILVLAVSACDKNKSNSIKVGVISGPEEQLMETALDVAKKRYHLDSKIVDFSDYNMPNAALNDGSIDINMFQHIPFLQEQLKQHHYDFTVIGKTFIYPMGIYSKKIKNLGDLESGAHVAIPNDPSNEARALLLLEKAKLIELDPKAGFNATPLDITSNPYQLVFSELDAAELPRALNDVDLAVINTNYAIPAGLSPTHDGLLIEDKSSPYANIVVVRTQNKDDPRFAQLMSALHSQEVIAKAKELFGAGAIPAFDSQQNNNHPGNQNNKN